MLAIFENCEKQVKLINNIRSRYNMNRTVEFQNELSVAVKAFFFIKNNSNYL